MKRWISLMLVAFAVVAASICLESRYMLPVGAQATTVSVNGAGMGVSSSGVLSGNGSGFTNLNATNISSGTLADGRLSSNVPLLNASNTFTGSLQTMPNLVATATAEFGPVVGASHQVVINPAVALTGYNSSDVPMYSFSNIDGSTVLGLITAPANPRAYLNNASTAITGIKLLNGTGSLSSGALSVTFPTSMFTALPHCTATLIDGGASPGATEPALAMTSITASGFALIASDAASTKSIGWICMGN